MRRALFVLLTLAVTGPALAAPAAKVVAKPKPVVVAQTPIDAQNYVLPPPIPLASQRPGGDAGQCRAACSKQLYFCSVDNDDGSCGSLFAQCSASCTATWTAPRFR